jgi:hypothetical protein
MILDTQKAQESREDESEDSDQWARAEYLNLKV